MTEPRHARKGRGPLRELALSFRLSLGYVGR